MNPVLQEILHNITARLAALEQIAESDKVLINLIQEQRAEIDRLRTIPSSKPWTGLTDEDTANICMQGDLNDWHDEQVIDAVEAKLKEKNT